MLACTRSLMNLASFSWTYCAPQINRSSDVRPIFDLASSCPPGASAAKTAETLSSPCWRIAAVSAGLASGMPGTYQLAVGSSTTSPSVAHSTTCVTRPLQEPQPLPARVRPITAPTPAQPSATASQIDCLETPLQ